MENQNDFANGSGLQASTWRYDTRWPDPVFGDKSPRVPSSYRVSIIDWGITDRLAEPLLPRMNTPESANHIKYLLSDLGKPAFSHSQLSPYSQEK